MIAWRLCLKKLTFKTQFEKFSYLSQQVSGPAKEIVDSVPDGNLNYDTAKGLLKDAFSCEVLQQFSVGDELVKSNLCSNNDIYHRISKARVLVDQMKRLKITSEVFAQYFCAMEYWTGLNNIL